MKWFVAYLIFGVVWALFNLARGDRTAVLDLVGIVWLTVVFGIGAALWRLVRKRDDTRYEDQVYGHRRRPMDKDK
jgi:hypothetical protein